MPKNNVTIPESIKAVVGLYGKDVVRDIRLSNILNDVSSFEELPAAKIVLRTILKEGYGLKLLEAEKESKDSQLIIRTFTSELSRNYGYQEDIVGYLFESIAYGLGWIDTMPAYNVGKANAETNRRKEYAISDLKGELANLKNEYKHLLETLLIIPEKTSAYYPAFALTQLDFIEGKIRLLSDALKTNDYEWCKQEKESVLLSHKKDTSSIKRKSYGKAIAAAATLLIGGIWGTNYMGSVKDREEFNQTIQQGDAFLSTGSYSQAISTYKDAYTNYDAFNSSSYKDDAFQKMEEATDRLIEEGKNDNTSLLAAYQTIQSELELDLTSSEKEILKNKLESVESDIATRIKNGYNTLALNISANKGKLDDTGKKLLDELLKLSPNDYWLNFIKNKEQ